MIESNFNTKNFLNLLTCPVEYKPLRNVVNLFPCCHKVNETVAKQYFGQLENGFCTKEAKCMLCNACVTSYAPDETIRKLAIQIFGEGKNVATLPPHSLIVEEKVDIVKLPYPGKPAIFAHCSGDWKTPFKSNAFLCEKKVTFVSTVEDSLITEFSLSGYMDGTIVLRVSLNNRGALSYFRSFRIIGSCGISGSHSFFVSSIPAIQTLFSIIARYNVIPHYHYQQLKEIIEKEGVTHHFPNKIEKGVTHHFPNKIVIEKSVLAYTNFEAKEFLNSLTCPIEKRPLTEAVNLFPCCHKVNESAAKQLFGQAEQNKCMHCNVTVTSYGPDHLVRDLAVRILGHEKNLDGLSTHPLVLEEKETVSLPSSYPGKAAVFIHREGNGCSRRIGFESVVDDSLITEFFLNLKGCYGIELLIKFKDVSARSHFCNQRVTDESFNSGSNYLSITSAKEVKAFFNILACNNEIPDENYQQLKEIIEQL